MIESIDRHVIVENPNSACNLLRKDGYVKRREQLQDSGINFTVVRWKKEENRFDIFYYLLAYF
jgi:hypothetical protein